VRFCWAFAQSETASSHLSSLAEFAELPEAAGPNELRICIGDGCADFTAEEGDTGTLTFTRGRPSATSGGSSCGCHRADRRLAMIVQQLLRLVQKLPFVLGPSALVTPPQLRQNFNSCPFTHAFIHSGHGNSHFWRNSANPAPTFPACFQLEMRHLGNSRIKTVN